MGTAARGELHETARQFLPADAPPYNHVRPERGRYAGSNEVMRGQYENLLTVGRLRNVEIQVMPSETGFFHSGLDGPMVLIETAEHKRFGYFESQNIGHVVGDPAEVSMFGLRYGKLRAQALNEQESAAFIRQLAGEK